MSEQNKPLKPNEISDDQDLDDLFQDINYIGNQAEDNQNNHGSADFWADSDSEQSSQSLDISISEAEIASATPFNALSFESELENSLENEIEELFQADSDLSLEADSGLVELELDLDEQDDLFSIDVETDNFQNIDNYLNFEPELAVSSESEVIDPDSFSLDDLEQELATASPADALDNWEEDISSSLDSEPSSLEDLDHLLELDADESELTGGSAKLAGEDLNELDDLLETPATADDLDELDGLLDSTPTEGSANVESNLLALDGFLDTDEPNTAESPSIETTSVKSSPVNSKSTPRTQKSKVFDQTMRVSVRKLDNLNNMIGELVVKRNRLEEDQERLRLFLDNLLGHVQSLGDLGARMHDLYERSLLEGALLASRQQHQSTAAARRANVNSSDFQADDDELGALEMDRFTGFHLLSQEIIELIVRVRESTSDIQFVVDESDKVTQSLRQVTTQLQEGINSSRMVTFGQTADRLPRAVRDIAYKLKKQAELNVEGRDVLIDKMIVEHLYNPMTHLVNNAITHGIETPKERLQKGKPAAGQINIRAFIQGNQTVITVSDDGAGIDPERVKAKAVEKKLVTWAQAQNLSQAEIYDFLFHPGFSTRDQADDFAGRGVGMDVVSTDLKKIRGTIGIESALGKGTTFTIRLPLVLSICKALVCNYNNTRIAFPIDGVEDTREYTSSEIQTNANGVKSITWQDTQLPFQSLSNLLNYNRRLTRGNIYSSRNKDEDILSIIILRSADNLQAVEVDEVLAEQEIVIKQIEGPIPKPAGIAGATVLGDGTIMPIADVLELIEIAQGKRTTEISLHLWQGVGKAQTVIEKTEPLVLVVDDSITVRELLSLSFNKLGYRVEQARDGQEAWDKLSSGLLCDMIFCDIEMPRMNGLELLSHLHQDEQLKQIPVAMLTSRGADKHRKLATDLGAAAYLTKPYTEKDLMDVAQRLIQLNQAHKSNDSMVVNPEQVGSEPGKQDEAAQISNPKVLIIDDSVTVRELLSMTFKKAGYQVEQARDGQEAWEKLRAGLDCDLALCDIEMPRLNGLELLARLQQDDKLASLPVAMLTSRGAQKMRNMAAKRGAKGYFVKPYVEDTLLEAAQRLLEGEVLIEKIDLDEPG